ncbi:MAG: Gfo/Idh/MocA family oxidoreductase [Deltaproteobacteria bacterium]|nr:Gfo/Idh/MocA family oxidoreductase [Deltaproteobacteria bacterium]
MTIGIAVVGAGRWGSNHIRNLLAMPRCRLRWVCDTSPAALVAIGQRFPGVVTAQRLDNVLGDAAVQAVVIAAPASAHAALATACLQAGKHVLVEKPLSTVLDDARALVAAAERAGRVLHVGHLCLHEPGVQRIRRLIEDGALGPLCVIDTDRTSQPGASLDVNVVWDLAVHDISIANFWAGAVPLRVAAVGTTDPSGRVAVVSALLQYPSGALARLRASWLGPAKVRRAVATGQCGVALFDALDRAAPVLFDDGKGPYAVDDVAAGEPLRIELECFLDAIADGAPSPADGQAGLDVARVLVAADRSLAAGGALVAVAPH